LGIGPHSSILYETTAKHVKVVLNLLFIFPLQLEILASKNFGQLLKLEEEFPKFGETYNSVLRSPKVPDKYK